LGLNTALKKYGTMSLKKVMAPAIAIAKKGFILTPAGERLLHFGNKYFKQQASAKESAYNMEYGA
jgi:gamma-glutamyltranspeptidase/glutathione hydrolase